MKLRSRLFPAVALSLLLAGAAGGPVSGGFVDPPLIVGASYHDISLDRSGSFVLVREMDLRAGVWALTASATLDAQQTLSVGSGDTTCRLATSNGGVHDHATWALTPTPDGGGTATMLLNGLAALSSEGAVRIECQSMSNVPVIMSNLRITAVRGTTSGAGSAATPRLASRSIATTFSFPASTSFRTLASINLPAGRWTLWAKVNVRNNSADPNKYTCRVVVGNNADQNVQSMAPSGQQGSKGQVGVQNAIVLSSAATVNFQCGKNPRPVVANFVRIVAMKGEQLLRTPIGGTTTVNGPAGTPSIVTAFRATSVNVPVGPNFSTIATMAVPESSVWLLHAKARLKDQNKFVQCKIEQESPISPPQTLGSFGGPASGNTGLYFLDGLGNTLDPNPTLSLRCRSTATGAALTHVRITLYGGEMSLAFRNIDPE